MIAPVTWSDERTARLTELWNEGKSATEIAIILGGLSRNAVVGKLDRLGLKRAGPSRPSAMIGRPKPGKSPKDVCETERKRLVAVVPVRPPPIVSSVIKHEPLNLSLMELVAIECAGGSTCRFPGAETGEHARFCGHLTKPGEPYCTYHSRVAYIPRELRMKKRAA